MKTALGSKLWLFHREEKARSVVISSHGGFYKGTRTFDLHNFHPQTEVFFYRDHGLAFSTGGKNIVAGQTTVAESHSWQRRPDVVNYALTKFQGEHGPNGEVAETYEAIEKAITDARSPARRQFAKDSQAALGRAVENNNARSIHLIMQGLAAAGDFEPRDVITVRAGSKLRQATTGEYEVFLSDVIAIAQKTFGYQRFYCSFCRVLIDPNFGMHHSQPVQRRTAAEFGQ